jgi:hypothetical protein
MNLFDWYTFLLGSIGGLVGLATGILAVREYLSRGRMQKLQCLNVLWDEFIKSEHNLRWVELLEAKSPRIRDISVHEKLALMGVLERASTYLDDRLVKPSDVLNFFGLIVLHIGASDDFWVGLEPESFFWLRFRRLELALFKALPKYHAENAKIQNKMRSIPEFHDPQLRTRLIESLRD